MALIMVLYLINAKGYREHASSTVRGELVILYKIRVAREGHIIV